jgi:hypothetical protein
LRLNYERSQLVQYLLANWYSPCCLRLQTNDASPHTNYLFRFLKSSLERLSRRADNYAAAFLKVNTALRFDSLSG